MKTRRTLNCWLWFFIYLLPIIFCVLCAISEIGGEGSIEFNTFWQNLASSFAGTKEPIAKALISIMENILGLTNTAAVQGLAVYIGYTVWVTLFRIFALLVTFLIDMIDKLIHGGQKNG